MSEPNPTIDLAKARAEWEAAKSYENWRVLDLARWANQYAENLLTALEQMQAAIATYSKVHGVLTDSDREKLKVLLPKEDHHA